MCEGTGLSSFEKHFPERVYDVGIAEQHAVTFAAGLAAQGMRPVICMYSTFLQRAYDQVVHDVATQDLPVTLWIIRAGIDNDVAAKCIITDVGQSSHDAPAAAPEIKNANGTAACRDIESRDRLNR